MSSTKKIFEQMITGDEFKDYRTEWCTERTRFSIKSASAFFIGVMLDRGQKAERAWRGGKHFVDTHFPDDRIWHNITKQGINRLTNICQKGFDGESYGLRFLFDAFPRHIKENAQIMIEYYEGDPRNIWNVSKNNVEEIYTRFSEFHGIGDALAKMAQFILVKEKGVAGGIESKQYLKIKPDIHVCKVLCRMGLSVGKTPKNAIKCVEKAKVSSQADLDSVLFNIGRKFCFKSEPNCTDCPLKKFCKKIL